MTKDRAMELLNHAHAWEYVLAHNIYVEHIGLFFPHPPRVYLMDEFNDWMEDFKPYEIATMVAKGNFNEGDDYWMLDDVHGIVSFTTARYMRDMFGDVERIAEDMVAHPADYFAELEDMLEDEE